MQNLVGLLIPILQFQPLGVLQAESRTRNRVSQQIVSIILEGVPFQRRHEHETLQLASPFVWKSGGLPHLLIHGLVRSHLQTHVQQAVHIHGHPNPVDIVVKRGRGIHGERAQMKLKNLGQAVPFRFFRKVANIPFLQHVHTTLKPYIHSFALPPSNTGACFDDATHHGEHAQNVHGIRFAGWMVFLPLLERRKPCVIVFHEQVLQRNPLLQRRLRHQGPNIGYQSREITLLIGITQQGIR